MILRLSKDDNPRAKKPPRWDEHYLFNVMSQAVVIQKMWICGPPLMDESFDKILAKLSHVFGLDFKTQIEIL